MSLRYNRSHSEQSVWRRKKSKLQPTPIPTINYLMNWQWVRQLSVILICLNIAGVIGLGMWHNHPITVEMHYDTPAVENHAGYSDEEIMNGSAEIKRRLEKMKHWGGMPWPNEYSITSQ